MNHRVPGSAKSHRRAKQQHQRLVVVKGTKRREIKLLRRAGWRRKRAFGARSRQGVLCCWMSDVGVMRYRPNSPDKSPRVRSIDLSTLPTSTTSAFCTTGRPSPVKSASRNVALDLSCESASYRSWGSKNFALIGFKDGFRVIAN